MTDILRILVVDDSAHDRASIKQNLLLIQDFRCSITEATTAEEAVELLEAADEEESPDVILLDVNMPGDGGLLVIESLSKIDGIPAIPVLVLTGSDGGRSASAFLQKGAQDYIGKSLLSPHFLHRIIQNAIERHRLYIQLRRSERIADAASRAKTTFLANMSHEIRTPMTAVLGLAELLLDEETEPDKLEHLEMIRSSGQYLLELINDTLDLSRIEAGRMEFESLWFKPERSIAMVESVLRKRAEESGLNFETRYLTDIPDKIQSDPVRVRQILTNLVGNAIKFTESGSVRIDVSMESESSSEWLRFDVSDTGIGISEKQQEQIFDPFTQASASTTRKFGGSGLGLAICGRLATGLGGELFVKSRRGEGSTFTFRMKLADDSMTRERTRPGLASAEDENHSETATELRQLDCRIIVAEDTAANQFLIRRLLESSGATVDVVENGQKLVERLEEDPAFDAVLLDMQMPVMDGYTAASEIRGRNIDLPIIALTASAFEADRNRCFEAGCNDYLSKPIDRALLIETLAKHVRT